VPPSLIEQQHRMLVRADHAADSSQVQDHRCGVAKGRHQGRVPRRAQRRVMPFFCPMRASSANPTSICTDTETQGLVCGISRRRWYNSAAIQS